MLHSKTKPSTKDTMAKNSFMYRGVGNHALYCDMEGIECTLSKQEKGI